MKSQELKEGDRILVGPPMVCKDACDWGTFHHFKKDQRLVYVSDRYGRPSRMMETCAWWQVKEVCRKDAAGWVKPPKDASRSWTVHPYAGRWYWYNDMGEPSIPYRTEMDAHDGLSDYDATYYD